MVAELRLWNQGRSEKEWTSGREELVERSNCLYHGELDKWDEWSWQLKRYVGLYKPLAKTLIDEIEVNAQKVVTDSVKPMLCNRHRLRITNCHCLLNNWHTCWHRSLMELRERLLGMKTQRMALDLASTVQPVLTAYESSCDESLE